MAISVMFGPGGSGKSFYQVHVIIKELRESRRNIVTNLALELETFNAYLEETYPDESLNLMERIRELTLEETRRFWEIRGPRTWKCETADNGQYHVIDHIDSTGEFGVAYVIDEAGQCGFSAAGWAQRQQSKRGADGEEVIQSRGASCLWYLEQQRKFSDNVYASTNGRSAGGIAKPFRDKAHDFTQLRNGYLRQFGIFKAQGKFTAWHFAQEPGPNVEFYKKTEFKMDPKIAACYRTQDGIGVHGSKADIGARAKGIPVLWALPFGVAICSLCLLVPWAGGKFIGKKMKDSQPMIQNLAKSANGAVQSKVSAAMGAEAKPQAAAKAKAEPEDSEEVYVTGYLVQKTRIGGNDLLSYRVALSDGEVFEDNEVRELGHGYWECDGKPYKFKPPKPEKNVTPAFVQQDHFKKG
jgi:hypothetical protein